MSLIEKIQSKAHELDPCTLSNYSEFTVKLTELQLEVSFEKKVVQGNVKYKLVKKSSTNKVVLDSKHLVIKQVKVNGSETKFTIAEEKPIYGSALTIPIATENEFTVEIDFETTSRCSAIQFIQGDSGPYIFSQCQAIHARTLFPCFDTPGVKSPYKFIGVSKLPMTMSGIPQESTKTNHYYFDQPIPIPSYLVSITSGNLKHLPIGPRSNVYSEEPFVKQCQWEFEKDMENFIQIAEKLVFDYEWGRFDSLVLPRSFPYGGMEIPNMTQLTPTLICGDRSQVKVMAHELAHSWSGNLVTNESWEHFWMNEGWTVYLERRILGEIAKLDAPQKGLDPEVYGEQVRHFNMINGWNDLVETCESFNPEFTKLVWDLKGKDPDDSFSKIPYEKGFFFLFHLETKVGGLKEFDPFIKHYFKKFRYQSLNTAKFIETLYDFYPSKKDALDSIDWNKWLFVSGVPEKPVFDTTLANQVYNLIDEWKKFYSTPEKFSSSDIENFEIEQDTLFLELLNENFKSLNVSIEIIRKFPEIYPRYHKSKNGEIVSRWNEFLISNGKYTSTDDVVVNFSENFLALNGRMKYIRPGYRLLRKGVSKEYAIEVFEKYKNIYHPICRTMVEKDLK